MTEVASRDQWGLRLLQFGVFLLPLACWPGLAHPFSTPKIWLLAALNAALAIHCLLRRREHSGAPQGGDWPWLIWLAAIAGSAALGAYVSLETLLLTVLPLPLCWAAWRGWVPAGGLMQAALLGSLVESSIVALQYGGLDPFGWIGWRPEAFSSSRMRVYGTLGNPNFVAAWLCATLPLYAGTFFKGRRRLAAWAAAFQLLAILATGSRVFLMTLPAAAAALALRGGRLGKWWVAGLAAAGALLWVSPARPLGVTIQGRLYLARVAVSHWRQIPLTGFGPGAFGVEFAQWQVEWLRGHPESARQFAGELDHAHNDYLEFWIDYGLVGLCAFLGLCGWLLVMAWRRTPAPDGAVWGAVTSLLAIACVDFPLHRPAEWGLYWLLLGTLGVQAVEHSTRRTERCPSR